MFGLTGPQGNHGEDAKEYWWYLDGLPSHALLRWRYHYPQAAFPYQQLIDENARRAATTPEFELLDTGVFDDDRYWVVDVTYAKASPTEVLARITVENHGPDEATLDVLPTLWFRNTWRWSGDERHPGAALDGRRDRGRAPPPRRLPPRGRAGRRRDAAAAVFCDNETNMARLFGAAPDHAVPEGRDQRPRGRRARPRSTRSSRARRPPGGTT